MNKLIDKVLSMRITVISIFTVLGIVCMMLFTITPVNYNMMDYLPKDANSTKALELMEEEFSIPMPNLDVMVEDVSLVEALQTKDIILSSEYVRDVIWLDDVTDIKIPMEFLPSELLESYYKDNSALFMVAVQDGYEKDSIASIRENLGEIDVKFSGTAAIQAQSQELAISEGARAGILIVPILIIILILFTKSYIEPLLYLITLGVAIMINLGTGFFFGGVSFVTLAAAPLLQLAVSIDYAVFLSHSYEGYRREYVPKEAIKLALKSSNKSILASMLTTMFGFMALLFMRFTIGFDMGVSLVKGVLLSYICVMVLLPVLLVSADEWIKKTKHRSFLPSFKGIGHVIVKCSIPLAFIIIVLGIPSFLAQSNNTFFYGTQESTEIDTEAYEIEQRYGATNYFVILVPNGDSTKEMQLCSELESLDFVDTVSSYTSLVTNKIPTQFVGKEVTENFYSQNYARIILYLGTEYEGDNAFNLVKEMREISEKYYPNESYTLGQSANLYDVKVVVEADNITVNLITLVSIFLVLLVMTRNIITPLLLMFTIQSSIWLNMAIPYFTGDNLCYIAYLVVSTVQMGATIDYAILLTNTYKEKRQSLNSKDAIKETLPEIFPSLLVSALTLTLCGICLSLASTNVIVQAVGVLVARGAILAVAMVMLFLPILIVFFDRFIKKQHIRLKKIGE